MTLQQLRYIVAIDEYRHFSKAAVSCEVTQSTMSLMVKKLEEELDVRIFDRDAYPVEATEIGRKIIDQAKVVLFNVDQIEELTMGEKRLLSGTLKVGLISTVAPVLVPGMYKYIAANYPSMTLITREMLTDTIIDRLHKAEIDIGIVTSPVDDPQIWEIPLYTERFFAYVSEDLPVYMEESIQSADLRRYPLWIMKNGLRLMRMEDIRGEEPSYEHFFEGGRVGTLLQIVNENGGMTVIPETHIRLVMYSWQKNIRPIVNPERRRTISLAIRKDYIHEAALNAVICAVKSIIPAGMMESNIKGDYVRL
ncbi:MAG: LysR family transcriptional regulator [Bacteroidales bacterium]|nr:LysR family transcriptional regulator [Bacteroidales bacterium]